MSLEIRPFRPDDYPALVEIFDAIDPESPQTVAEMRHHDEHREADKVFARLVAERDGRVVGCADYSHFSEGFHPRKFSLGVSVHPDYQRQGVGSALYDAAMAGLEYVRPAPDSQRNAGRSGGRGALSREARLRRGHARAGSPG